jgi:hypothetical protein
MGLFKGTMKVHGDAAAGLYNAVLAVFAGAGV